MKREYILYLVALVTICVASGFVGWGLTSHETEYVYPSARLYVCDGVDDQYEINDACEFASDGGIVFLSSGEYNITSNINVSNTTLIGSNEINTSLHMGNNAILAIKNNGHISKLHLDCYFK